MKPELVGLSRQYQAQLRNHLKLGTRTSLSPAQALGRKAMKRGRETLDLAKIHERALVSLVLPSYTSARRGAMMRRAGAFFAEAITPIAETHRTAREANAELSLMIKTLGQRSKDLAASNLQLKREIARRQTVESALRESEQHYGVLLEQSRAFQEQLRHLSRQILTAQEEDRKMISRELHDEIAQTLTGINMQLASLKTAATVNTKDLQRKISDTQRLVEKSVNIVHRFALKLRPTVLDDLGLIPALHSFVQTFSKHSGLPVRLTLFAGVERLDNAKRTVLFRIAQEAMTNVARHAHAKGVLVSIQKHAKAVRMEIKDDGKSFHVERTLRAAGNKRLGLLGMRERAEMVGGSFCVESAPGVGTTVQVDIPFAQFRKATAKKSRDRALKCP